jgi:hypothetical protein
VGAGESWDSHFGRALSLGGRTSYAAGSYWSKWSSRARAAHWARLRTFSLSKIL